MYLPQCHKAFRRRTGRGGLVWFVLVDGMFASKVRRHKALGRLTGQG